MCPSKPYKIRTMRYIDMYIQTYNIYQPSPLGAIRLQIIVVILCLLSYVSFNLMSLHLHPSSPVCCILYPVSFNPVYQQTGCSMVGQGATCCHQLGWCSQPGSPQGIPEKSSNFKPVSKTFKNQKNLSPRSPKGIQMTSKIIPPDTKLLNR
jgi:hypothetical protein